MVCLPVADILDEVLSYLLQCLYLSSHNVDKNAGSVQRASNL